MSDDTVIDQNDHVAAEALGQFSEWCDRLQREKNDLDRHQTEVMTEAEGRCYVFRAPTRSTFITYNNILRRGHNPPGVSPEVRGQRQRGKR